MDMESEGLAGHRAVLAGSFLQAHTPTTTSELLGPAQMLAEVALSLALPLPTDEAEMREQIAALQSGSLRGYAAANERWAYPVMSSVQARIPDPECVPRAQRNGHPWTPASWRSYVRSWSPRAANVESVDGTRQC